MTDPIPDEAVEAANRALHARHDADDVFAGDARAAVEAAAPHIAAQARAMPAENLQIVNGWLVERGAHDLDYPAGAAYGPYPDSDAEPLVKLDELPGWPGDIADLRAGIEALRDEMPVLTTELCGHEPDEHPEGCCDVCDLAFAIDSEVRDRLDALLRGA